MDVRKKVPREAIIRQFGCFLAINPEIFASLVKQLAQEHDVSPEELRPYIDEVLRTQPPYED